MKLLLFESKKFFRLPGIRFLLISALVLSLLLGIMCPILSPTDAEQESYINGYDDNIRYIIRLAELYAVEYEASVGGDNYNVRYQYDVAERYTHLLDASVKPSEVRGWNEFFSMTADDVIMVVLVMLVAIMSTMTEWDTGTASLLAKSKRGTHSIVSKIGFLTLFAFTVVIGVHATTAAGISIRLGLSSPFVPICSVMQFANCPYNISIFTYLIVSGLIKVIHFMCLSAIASLAAALTKIWLVSFISSAAVIITGYGLSTIQSSNGLLLCNPYTLALTNPLFERYRAVNVMNYSVSLTIITILLIVLVFLITATMYVMIMLRGLGGRSLANSEKRILSALRIILERVASRLPRRKPKQHSLFFTEAKKSFVKSHLIILCLVMLLVKISYTSYTVPKIDPGELFYKELCETMEGELTLEKRQFVETALDDADQIISQHDSMRNALQDNRITGEEYSAYMDKYYRAQVEQFAYSKLNAQCQRIDMLAENGQTANIVYDSGWKYAFSLRFDVVLAGFLLLFFSYIYDMEYKSDVYRIASISARGMTSLHKAKYQLALIVTAVAFLIFFGVDLVYILQTYTLPQSFFSASVIMDTSISLGTALLIHTCIKLFVVTLYASLIVILARGLRRTYLTLPVGLLVLAVFGVVTNL